MTALPAEYKSAARRQVLARLLLIALMVTLVVLGKWPLALILLALVIAVEAWVVLSPTTRVLGPVVDRLPLGRDEVLITIDDGPDPETTPALLDLLEAKQARAVFFVIGEKVQKWPHLAREILRRGHELGNHTQHHYAGRFWSLGPVTTWREIAECQQTLREVVGTAPRWFRAPAGHFQSYTHPALKSLNLRLMAWSCRGYDGLDNHIPRILKRIASSLKPGGIVLLHEARPVSAELLSSTLELIEQRGLSLAEPASWQEQGDC